MSFEARVLKFNEVTNGDLEGGALLGFAVIRGERFHLVFDEEAFDLTSPRDVSGLTKSILVEEIPRALSQKSLFHWNMAEWEVFARKRCISIPLGEYYERRLRRGNRFTFTVIRTVGEPETEYRILERFRDHSGLESMFLYYARLLPRRGRELGDDIQLIQELLRRKERIG